MTSREAKPPQGIYQHLAQAVERAEGVEGISAADMLVMPEELARVVHEVMRLDVATLDAIASQVDVDPDELEPLLETLVDKGYVRVMDVEGTTCYHARFARRRGRYVPSGIWRALSESVDR